MSRVHIVNATAENFKIEVMASQPSSGSSGDHQDGRLVKYGKHVYIWHDTDGDWIKFPNAENYSSVETRLSVQESDRAAADASLQTIDLSLQTRIAAAEVARSQAVSSEASSMSSADSSLTTRLAAAETARSTAVSSEASSMASADTSLTTKISTAEDARSADVSSEASRALSAQTSVQLRASQEESNEASAEASLDARVSAQSSSRVVAVNSVATVLGTATSNRSSGDSSLQTLIETEEARIDAMLNAAAADKDTFVEVVSFINATDVTSDGELSTEFSTLTSSVASAATARGAADTSLQTRLSTEESTRLAKDTSLETRLSVEESSEASAEASLDARSSAASSARLSADTSRASDISDAASNRGSADTSLSTRISTEESARLSAVTSMNSRASSMESTNVSAAASLNSKVSVATSARASAASSVAASVSVALSSEASSVAVADASLTTRISAEEVARASADTSLSTELSSQASARTSADLSLTTRLSTEESVETSAEASHNVRASSEISARASADLSLNVKYSAEFSVERSRVDAILDSAAADKDTFVEVVSFLTAVDTASDDVLASYVVAIDADISSEASTQASADASLTTRLSTEESAETAALSVQQSTSESAEASVQAKISTLESHEDKRHVRIDFTDETSFSVASGDLPAGFAAGNGMVQVFQDMGSSTYRHLVAPASVNPSTGAMTFDLGTSAKSGFAVFYSFASDETTVTEKQTNPSFYISGFDGSGLSDDNGGSSSMTFTVAGVGSEANAKKYYNLLEPYAMHSSNYGGYYYGSSDLSTSWNAGYTEVTFSWTNSQAPTNSGGYQYLNILWGHQLTTYSAMTWSIKIDASSKALDSGTGLGAAGLSGDAYVSPPYAIASDGFSAYTNMHTWATGSQGSSVRYFRGPKWTFVAKESVYQNSQRNNPQQAADIYTKGHCTMTIGGTDYYYSTHGSTLGASHRLYSEVTSGRSLYSPSSVNKRYIRMDPPRSNGDGSFIMGYYGKDTSGTTYNTLSSQPDPSTNCTFYFPAEGTTTFAGDYSTHADAQYDLKIVIAMSDRTAGNMSMTVYRSDASAESPSWTEVDRMYYSGHNPS